MKYACRVVLSVLLIPCAGLAIGTQGPLLKSKSLKPAPCSKCTDGHGDVVVTFEGGAPRQLTETHMAVLLRAAADRRTLGWVESKHLDRAAAGVGSGIVSIADHLEIRRDGHLVRRIAPGNALVKDWGFRDGARLVAIHSAPLKVGDAFTLVDIGSGKEVRSYSPGQGKQPGWAAGLE